MAEELKDEAICTAHSSVECRERCMFSYEPPRGCKLQLTGNRPYRSTCEFRLVIKAPIKKDEPLPEIPELKPIETKPVKPTTDELPF
jgi:hypothetical protein